MLSSLTAEVTISPMTLPCLWSSMANMLSSVKVSGFISKLVPVRAISSFQCLGQTKSHEIQCSDLEVLMFCFSDADSLLILIHYHNNIHYTCQRIREFLQIWENEQCIELDTSKFNTLNRNRKQFFLFLKKQKQWWKQKTDSIPCHYIEIIHIGVKTIMLFFMYLMCLQS